MKKWLIYYLLDNWRPDDPEKFIKDLMDKWLPSKHLSNNPPKGTRKSKAGGIIVAIVGMILFAGVAMAQEMEGSSWVLELRGKITSSYLGNHNAERFRIVETMNLEIKGQYENLTVYYNNNDYAQGVAWSFDSDGDKTLTVVAAIDQGTFECAFHGRTGGRAYKGIGLMRIEIAPEDYTITPVKCRLHR